jgi:NADH-quinone oxidoreductase subunit L
MIWIVKNLWLIPALPLFAAGIIAVNKQPARKLAATLAIGSMALGFLLSLCAFAATLGHHGDGVFREVFSFNWLQFGGPDNWLQLGWVLDPLTAIMLVMVTFVGMLIFIFSVGYMAHDQNFMRFFCFLALFASGMLGVVIANNLFLFFVSWEIVGLTSYLLIGFWYHKPSAAAAAKKAFVTTRIGDLGLLIGMVWLYAETGTLNFYDGGKGCLESGALTTMLTHATIGGMAVSTMIGLLIFLGAVGKSGQVPLHVWLPDAMEGPTPVSALIHAATMVAAGVFLVARVYPLMSIGGIIGAHGVPVTTSLTVITWVGAITAIFAASIAVAQNDIKRILAYSTVSQLGYMMMGLGVGGVAVGMFHLITHAFFKALLFLGSGSVIHGCHEEQDVRKMGGLKKYMPVTFAVYAVGMLALAGFPLFFSGFWSKDEILHAAHGWSVSHVPFYLGCTGALFTAFYMTRQVALVFFGSYRGHDHFISTGLQPGVASAVNAKAVSTASLHGKAAEAAGSSSLQTTGLKPGANENTILHGHAGHSSHSSSSSHSHDPHESPAVMTVPLIILAGFAILLGFVGTPAWPWFDGYLTGEEFKFDFSKLTEPGTLGLMVASAAIVFTGLGLGWFLYGKRQRKTVAEKDVLESAQPFIYKLLENKYFIDEIYEATVIRFNAFAAWLCDFADQWIFGGAVLLVKYITVGLAWLYRWTDEYFVNLGFDIGCEALREGGGGLSKLHTGRVQTYLRVIGIALVALIIFLIWGRKA